MPCSISDKEPRSTYLGASVLSSLPRCPSASTSSLCPSEVQHLSLKGTQVSLPILRQLLVSGTDAYRAIPSTPHKLPPPFPSHLPRDAVCFLVPMFLRSADSHACLFLSSFFFLLSFFSASSQPPPSRALQSTPPSILIAVAIFSHLPSSTLSIQLPPPSALLRINPIRPIPSPQTNSSYDLPHQPPFPRKETSLLSSRPRRPRTRFSHIPDQATRPANRNPLRHMPG